MNFVMNFLTWPPGSFHAKNTLKNTCVCTLNLRENDIQINSAKFSLILGPYSILNDDVSLGHHSKRKRSWSRAVFSNLQRKGLEKRFEVQKYVTKPDRRQLAAMLGLTDAQVRLQNFLKFTIIFGGVFSSYFANFIVGFFRGVSGGFLVLIFYFFICLLYEFCSFYFLYRVSS